MPKKSKPKKPADANLHIRLPAKEKAAFIDAAFKQRLNFTTWVRLWLRRGAGLDKR